MRGLVAVAVLWLACSLVPAPASACAVCFGDPDSAATAGMNNAILTLLAVVGVVQVGFVAMFVSFRRRSRRLEEQRKRFRLIEGGAR